METRPIDPVIDEIRAVRHRISGRFDHDPRRLVDYYMALQEDYRDRLLVPSDRPVAFSDPESAPRPSAALTATDSGETAPHD